MWKSSGLGARLATLWRRFQYWRGMRIYVRLQRMELDALELKARADRMIGRNVRPPMPLFDMHDGFDPARKTAERLDRRA